MAETMILKIDPPLPCAVLEGSETCGRLSHMAYAYPTRGPRSGVWLIMPVCDRCAGKGRMPGADSAQKDQEPPEAD